MKSTLTILLTFIVAASLQAQLELPAKSPKASVSYRVGLTDVTVTYSSPAVRGRKIWGEVVPYDKLWRAGANQATTIEFSTDVKIDGKDLPKGKYALFLIPKEGDTWTAILNTVTDQWGGYNYDQSKDALRAEVQTKTVVQEEEHLQYTIENQGIDRGYIRLAWDKKRIYLPFSADVMKFSMTNIENALMTAPAADKWWIHAEAAEFIAENDGDLNLALQHADESAALRVDVWNWWVKARVQAKRGDYRAALATAQKLVELSKTNDEYKYYPEIKAEVEKAMAEWKKM
ncbi:MAG: DUF2911 domain-containing protein [Saprospiraceae bacterium]|nr:DUF2911 domain-containing protein [Saprospiraceae bacterium]